MHLYIYIYSFHNIYIPKIIHIVLRKKLCIKRYYMIDKYFLKNIYNANFYFL